MVKDIDVLVIGSLNIDIVVEAERQPRPGETIRGTSFFTVPGGKGANQAVAASRLGLNVKMLGCVGADEYGCQAVEALAHNGVDVSGIARVSGGSTGCALITVVGGENTIILFEGANAHCIPSAFDALEDEIARARILLMQMEIPAEMTRRAGEIARANGTLFILNPAPAPAQMMSREMLSLVDVLMPNEHEAKSLLAIAPEAPMRPEEIVTAFADAGFDGEVVATLGSQGAVYRDGDEILVQPAYEVQAVDTTGAGDAFIAGFCYGRLNLARREAVAFAAAAAAINVTYYGAQPGLPTREEVESFLRERAGGQGA